MSIQPSRFTLIQLFLIGLIIVNAFLLVYYQVYTYHFFIFHSDAAVTNLLAQEIYDTKQFFPHDWTYVNQDIWVWGSHLFILCLLPFFKNGYWLHAVAGSLTTIIILFGVYLITRMLRLNLTSRLCLFALFLSGFSRPIADNLYGQHAYGTFLYLTLFLIYATYRVIHTPTTKLNANILFHYGLIFCIFLVVTWGNPLRSAALFMLPYCAGLLTVVIGAPLSEKKLLRLKCLYLVLIVMVGYCLGCSLHSHTALANTIQIGISTQPMPSFNQLPAQLWNTLATLLIELNGALPSLSLPWLSFDNLFELFRLSIACLFLLSIFFIILKTMKSQHVGERMLCGYAACAFVIPLFLMAFTTFSWADDFGHQGRYFDIQLILLILLVPSYLKSNNTFLLTRIFAASIFTLMFFALQSFTCPAGFSPNDLAKFLIQHNLKYGYAGYWNANVLTVASNFQVKVRPLILPGEYLQPMRWLSSNRWYTPEAYTGKTFILLYQQEYTNINLRALTKFIGSPIHTYSINGFYIVVYASNISGKLPGWKI